MTEKLSAYKQMGDNISKVFTHDWIFGSAIEKLIITGMFLWCMFSIYLWIRGFFL
jgi:hypothetical protein